MWTLNFCKISICVQIHLKIPHTVRIYNLTFSQGAASNLDCSKCKKHSCRNCNFPGGTLAETAAFLFFSDAPICSLLQPCAAFGGKFDELYGILLESVWKMGKQGYNEVLRRKCQAKYNRYVKGETVGQVLHEILGCKHSTQTAFVKVGGQGMAGVLQVFRGLLWCHCIACKTLSNPGKTCKSTFQVKRSCSKQPLKGLYDTIIVLRSSNILRSGSEHNHTS